MMPEAKELKPDKRRQKKTIESRVRAMVCEQFLCEPEAVTPGTHFRNDLEADSLDVIELAMRIEEHFDIEITDDDEDPHLGTFESTCALVTAKMRKQGRKVGREVEDAGTLLEGDDTGLVLLSEVQ